MQAAVKLTEGAASPAVTIPSSSSLCADTAEMERAIRLLYPQDCVIELRVLGDIPAGGFYDGASELIEDAVRASQKARGVYVTLNPLNTDNERLVTNSLTPGFRGASDSAIATRELLLIDIDAERAPNTNASDDEHEAAINLARDIRYCLREEGWPDPLLGDSGNGAHLIYRLPSLPNNEQSTSLIKAALMELDARHSRNRLKVDRSVFNTSRISKLYGTMTRKGPHSTERPQRMARIIEAPESLEPVAPDLLKALAGSYVPDEPPPTREQRHMAGVKGFTIETFISRHNIQTRPKRAYKDGYRWQMDCPFNTSHKTPDSALYELGSGALAFKCSHDSCSDKSWADFRALYEPQYATDRTSKQERTAYGNAETKVIPISSGWSIDSIPDLSSLPERKLEYAVEGLILKAAITLVTGEPASGKSTLLTAMTEAISLGKLFCGLKTQKSPVLIMDRENSIPVVQDRLKRVNVKTNPNLRYWGSWVDPRPADLNDSALLDYVVSCEEKPIIIVDSFNAFHCGDENNAQDTRDYLKPVRALANAGAAVVMIHHVGKSETSKKYRGSSVILGEIDAGLLIENKSDAPGLGVLSVVPFKSRVLGMGVPDFRYIHGTGFEACGQSRNAKGLSMPEDQRTLVEIIKANPGMGSAEFQKLAEQRGVSRARARAFLDTSKRDGLVLVLPGDRGKKHHHWHDTQAPEGRVN